jgi:hypothetical protein
VKEMNIFLAIMTVIIILLITAEKNDKKRQHLTWAFIAAIAGLSIISVVNMVLVMP